MGGQDAGPSGPDLVKGVDLSAIPDGGSLLGQANGESVLLCRAGHDVYAVGPKCSHYGGPLGEGVVHTRDGACEVRCPWHHARFDLRDGRPVGGPGMNPIPTWEVRRQGTKVIVGARRPDFTRKRQRFSGPPTVIVVGAGAAGNAACEGLRNAGYDGPLLLVSNEGTPVDRPNLSKDWLAGTAPDEWMPLRDEAFYRSLAVDLQVGRGASAIDAGKKKKIKFGGMSLTWDALILATGCSPRRLDVPGADRSHVHVLRTWADAKKIAERIGKAERAVVIGSSFIGLEVAASLRTRGLEVDVVGPDKVPLERVLGPELGAFVRRLHEEKGVRFHLGHVPKAIEKDAVVLDDGTRLPAKLVVVGVGVTPNVALAETAGCRVDNGVVVDAQMRTSVPGIFAIGDVARYPHPHVPGHLVRTEHWVHAERMGFTLSRILMKEPGVAFRSPPFFWSQHYDVPINRVGWDDAWDTADVRGSIDGRDCAIAYRQKGRIVAFASIFRDKDCLLAEAALERDDQPALEALLR